MDDHRALVSCVGSSLKKSSESFEDVFGGLGPDEWSGVVVPGLHPGSDIGFERLDASVVTALEQVLGEVGEPAFDLVEPAGVGRGVVQGEPADVPHFWPTICAPIVMRSAWWRCSCGWGRRAGRGPVVGAG